MADTATLSAAETEDSGELDLSRLSVAIVRSSFESDLGNSGTPESPLTGIVAQGLVGLAYYGTISPSAHFNLGLDQRVDDSRRGDREDTPGTSLSPLGVRSLGPLEGGLASDESAQAAVLPAITVGGPHTPRGVATESRAALANDETPPAPPAVPERDPSVRWNWRVAALSANLVSVVMLTAWRPGLLDRFRQALRFGRPRKLARDRKRGLANVSDQ